MTTRRVYLHEGAVGWVESTDVAGVWRVLNDCTPAGPAFGDLVRLQPELDDAAYALAEHLPRAVPVRLPDPRSPDPWDGMSDEHWAALAAVFPLPDPVGGHGDVLADLGATSGPIGAAFRARRLLGLSLYGQPLRYGDGRPPGVDAFQEALDLGAYRVRDGRTRGDGFAVMLAYIDRDALADAFWGLDVMEQGWLRRMVDAAVAGVDLPLSGKSREAGAHAPPGGRAS